MVQHSGKEVSKHIKIKKSKNSQNLIFDETSKLLSADRDANQFKLPQNISRALIVHVQTSNSTMT